MFLLQTFSHELWKRSFSFFLSIQIWTRDIQRQFPLLRMVMGEKVGWDLVGERGILMRWESWPSCQTSFPLFLSMSLCRSLDGQVKTRTRTRHGAKAKVKKTKLLHFFRLLLLHFVLEVFTRHTKKKTWDSWRWEIEHGEVIRRVKVWNIPKTEESRSDVGCLSSYYMSSCATGAYRYFPLVHLNSHW